MTVESPAEVRAGHSDGHGYGRNPELIKPLLPALDFLLAYFDPEVQGFENLPAWGPMLIVSNHSGGIYMPDYWAFVRHWVRERGAAEPLYSLSYDLIFSIPGLGSMARSFGAVAASREKASRLLEEGHAVLVYPGGDQDDYRFSRGDGLARRIGIDKWLRVKVLPLVAGLPWGVAVAPIPTLPLLAKVTSRVCEPLDWSGYGADAADDPAVVRHCYEELLGRMQANLDELVAAEPHPVLARLRDPARHGSLARHKR